MGEPSMRFGSTSSLCERTSRDRDVDATMSVSQRPSCGRRGICAGNPATPRVHVGPEALRHCLTTVLPRTSTLHTRCAVMVCRNRRDVKAVGLNSTAYLTNVRYSLFELAPTQVDLRAVESSSGRSKLSAPPCRSLLRRS